MKLSPFICAIWVAASFPSWAGDQQGRFLEFQYDDSAVAFDLNSVRMIEAGRFTVTEKDTDTPKVMRFELNVLARLRSYCARASGQYPAPANLAMIGRPDLPLENIEVKRDKTRIDGTAYPFKIVSWSYPYKKLAQKSVILHCGKFSRTEDQLYTKARTGIMNGVRLKDFFDCTRGLQGILMNGSDDPTKAIAVSVTKDSEAFKVYRSICLAVTHEEPYVPQ